MTRGPVAIIAASAEDTLAESVSAELRRRGVGVLVLDTALPVSTIELELELDAGPCGPRGKVGLLGGEAAAIEAISGVLWRTHEPFVLDADLHPDDHAFARSETTAAWDGLLTALGCPVLNRPMAVGAPFWCTPAPLRALHAADLGSPDVVVGRAPARRDLPAADRWLVGAARATARGKLVASGALDDALAGVAGELACVVAIPTGRLLDLVLVGGVVLAMEHTDAGARRLVPAPAAAIPPIVALLAHLGLDFAAVRVVETAPGAFTCVDVEVAPGLDGLDGAAQRALLQGVASALCQGAGL